MANTPAACSAKSRIFATSIHRCTVFYWHFADLRAFHARVIERWKQVATEAIIADLERYESREKRLDVLLRHAFARGAALEIRVRAWAENNAAAARALAEVDARRRGYIERMLLDSGIAPALAATRTQILYWTYLGAALSRGKLTGQRIELIVADLKRVALGPPPANGRKGRRNAVRPPRATEQRIAR